MNLTTANVDVKNYNLRIRNTELDELTIRGDEPTIRGDEFLYKLIKQSIRRIEIATMFSYDSPGPLLMEGLLHYIVPFELSWSYTC